MKLRVEFDDFGGYDCMSAAYIIRDERGRAIATLDVKDYVHAANGSEEAYQEVPELEAIARQMAAAASTEVTDAN